MIAGDYESIVLIARKQRAGWKERDQEETGRFIARVRFDQWQDQSNDHRDSL